MIDFKPIFFDSLDSTNLEAKRLIANDQEQGIVVVADEQTQGRGRLGRRWISQKGNFFATIVVQPEKDVSQLGSLSLVVGIAVARTLKPYLSERHILTLKWPNDVLVNGQKISGILVETDTDIDGDGNISCYIGVGINILSAPVMVAYPCTSLAECDVTNVSRDQLLYTLLENFGQLYQTWCNEGFVNLHQEWTASAYGIGRRVKILIQPGQEIEGQYLGVTESGAMNIKDFNGIYHTVYSTEILFI